jgi:hypothetical protein
MADGTTDSSDAVGYEPSLALSGDGTLAITAHKALAQPTHGSGLASFLYVSTDNGTTWHAPGQAPTGGAGDYRLFPSLEGDVAFDGRGWLYFVDTYLGDATLHAWSNRGETLQYGKPLASTGYDDRPWIAAQGEGVVHYAGYCCFPLDSATNNVPDLPASQYCRSTDGGLTFGTCTLLDGRGTNALAADRDGTGLYIVYQTNSTETTVATDFAVVSSHDRGATLSEPVVAAHRSGDPGGGFEFPMAAIDGLGNGAFVWQEEDADDHNGTHLYLTQTPDGGAHWTTEDITPFPVAVAFPTIARDAKGDTAVAFYGTTDLPVSTVSRWFLYAGEAAPGLPLTFARADDRVLYAGASPYDAFHDLFKIALEESGVIDVAYMSNQVLPLPVPYGSVLGSTPQVWFVRGQAGT